MARGKRTKLSIYLLKEGKGDPSAFLLDTSLPETDIGNNISVYRVQASSNAPIWQKSFLQNKVEGFYSNVTGAVVKIPLNIDGAVRVFLISFGYGHSKINIGACEEQFGLRTALNIGDVEQVRSISRRNISATPKLALEQLAKQESLSSFGVDVEQDIMQNIVLASVDKDKYGQTLVGGVSLRLTTSDNIDRINNLLIDLYENYQLESYKQRGYSWIDNIFIVKDRERIAMLDASLLDAFMSYTDDDKNGLTVAPPDILDWEDVSGFSSSTKRAVHIKESIDIEDYGEIDNMDQIQSKNVFMWSESRNCVARQWPLYRCLNYEVDMDGAHYVLTNGKWYEIKQDYASEVEAWYSSLNIPNSELPLYRKILGSDGNMVHSEQHYNKQCMGFQCLDCDYIYFGGNRKIEACDLYKDNNFIHVKIYDGSSAPISHLVAQAMNSAKMFFSDSSFRKVLNDKLENKLSERQLASPSRDDYTVTLAIITNKEKLNIPFFSKINLKSFFTQLELMGIRNIRLERIAGNW